jgi:integrase
MMGRPPLPIGTYGDVRCYPVGKKFRAVTNYRDYDGVIRTVERRAKTEAAARNRLREALRDRARAVAGEEVTTQSRVGAVAELWLRDLQESGKALRTKNTYRRTWQCDLAKAVDGLRVHEITVSLADRVLRSIRETAGPGTAKHAKVVLTGILDLAVRYGAIDSNPVRDVVLSYAGKRKGPKAKAVLAGADLPKLREHLRGLQHAQDYDLVDLVDMLSALGCRIGELLALDWTCTDFDRGIVRIEGTVIREPGVGLFVQHHTKSSAGMRTLKVPSWAMAILRRRFDTRTSEWVFPSSTGKLRDPDNTRKQLRHAVDSTEWAGLHPHAFRHLVATRLDEAGLSAREIADYLGHERVSMTQDVYMNRKVAGHAAAQALDGMAPPD